MLVKNCLARQKRILLLFPRLGTYLLFSAPTYLIVLIGSMNADSGVRVGSWTVEKRDGFKAYISQAIDAWASLTEQSNNRYFSGDEDEVRRLGIGLTIQHHIFVPVLRIQIQYQSRRRVPRINCSPPHHQNQNQFPTQRRWSQTLGVAV